MDKELCTVSDEDCHKLQDWAGEIPFTSYVIPRVGPPRCPYCGELMGKCDHDIR